MPGRSIAEMFTDFIMEFLEGCLLEDDEEDDNDGEDEETTS
jgi:hypothetical protein